MANFSYVIDSTFNPFSMQEMLVPFQGYEEAYDKAEARLEDIADKAKRYEYLSQNLPEDSTARQIFEGYNNDLQNMSSDFQENGLSQNNIGALNSLRQRYQGEIGRLDRAQTALEEEQKLRRTMSAQDPSMLYATDNLNIDTFLDNNKPDLYGVSGDALYKRGMEIGASSSSREYGNMEEIGKVAKYYQEIGRKIGYTPELLAKFRQDINSIPELQQAVDATLKEKGVTGHLTGANYERAKEAVVNGIVNGAVYKVDSQLQQNLGVLTAAQQEQKREFDVNQQMEQDKFKIALLQAGLKKDDNGNIVLDENNPYLKAKTQLKGSTKGKTGGNGNSSTEGSVLKNPIKITYDGKNNTTEELPTIKDSGSDTDTAKANSSRKYSGNQYSWYELNNHIKKGKISHAVLRGVPVQVMEHPDWYTYYFKDYNADDKDRAASLTIVPTESRKANTSIANTSIPQNAASIASQLAL